MKSALLRSLLVITFTVMSLHVYGQNEYSSNCNDPAGGCDTVGIQHKISPWRIGLFVGPAVAYCGSWENTFNSDKFRDKSLFNGIGFNAAFNADYYFNKSQTSRLKFGLGAVAGIQNFFLRKDVNPFLERLINNAGSRNPVIQKAPSEDFYLTFGPVLTFSFTNSIRSPYLEASVRGGVFRTTPAAIFVYDGTTGDNVYSVTASNKRYYPGLLATLGFFIPSKNNLWAWGIEATGFRTKVDYIFPGATIYPYTRKHGGFSAGVAVRRRFEKDIPVAKEPTPPIVCVAPEIDIMMDGQSIKGYNFNLKKDTTQVDSLMLTWRTRSTPDSATTETFTARIHQLNNGQDKVIAQVLCVKENKLLWPAEYLAPNGHPVMGQYLVTVQSNRVSSCASCVSEASATGFAVRDSVIIPPPLPPVLCYKQCDLEIYAYQRVRKGTRIKYGKSPESCEDCICPIDTVARYVSVYRLLGTTKRDSCDANYLNVRDEVAKADIKFPSWVRTIYVKVRSTVLGDCDVPQGVTVKNYSATYRRGVVGVFKEIPQK